MQKTISEMAKFIKELIPADTLDGYPLNPMLKSVASDAEIRNGVLAFKEFLYKLYDRLITDGGIYEKPSKKNNDSGHGNVVSLSVGYPFINNMTSILINIGYYGNLNEDGNSIVCRNFQSLSSTIGPQGGHLGAQDERKQNISDPKVVEILRFLTSCGLTFDEIDLDAKKIDLSKWNLVSISYSDNPAMLTGLKAMAIAHIELSTQNDYYVFQRCDYRLLRSETPDVNTLLKSSVHSLPSEVQDFILKLHQRYIEAGLICKMKMHYFGIIFSYSYKSNVIWDFIPSPDGCYIFTKAKNMDKYADDIDKFNIVLQEKITCGYGCDKKMFGKPCQKGCHGYSFPLDNSILSIGQDIEIWLDKEVSCLTKK